MNAFAMLVGCIIAIALVGLGIVIMGFGGVCVEHTVGLGIMLMLVGGVVMGLGVLLLWRILKGFLN